MVMQSHTHTAVVVSTEGASTCIRPAQRWRLVMIVRTRVISTGATEGLEQLEPPNAQTCNNNSSSGPELEKTNMPLPSLELRVGNYMHYVTSGK